VPVDEKSVVGYTVTVGWSQIYDDAYNRPPGKPQAAGTSTSSWLSDEVDADRADAQLQQRVVGAVQLINAKRRYEPSSPSPASNRGRELSTRGPRDDQSIASQAAVALDNKSLLDSIQSLFDGFVQASVTAIEQRDPSTARHSVASSR